MIVSPRKSPSLCFQHNINARPRQQEAEYHSGGPAAKMQAVPMRRSLAM